MHEINPHWISSKSIRIDKYTADANILNNSVVLIFFKKEKKQFHDYT